MRTVEYRWSQIRVGLFTAITGIVFFVVVFYFGLTGTSLAGHVKVHAAFDNIFGISNGSPVSSDRAQRFATSG